MNTPPDPFNLAGNRRITMPGGNVATVTPENRVTHLTNPAGMPCPDMPADVIGLPPRYAYRRGWDDSRAQIHNDEAEALARIRASPAYATEMARLDAKIAASTPVLRVPFDRERFEQAPCYLCGYNGRGYFDSDVHPCAALRFGQAPDTDERLPGDLRWKLDNLNPSRGGVELTPGEWQYVRAALTKR